MTTYKTYKTISVEQLKNDQVWDDYCVYTMDMIQTLQEYSAGNVERLYTLSQMLQSKLAEVNIELGTLPNVELEN